jgi:cation diffusion facilitator family transporter
MEANDAIRRLSRLLWGILFLNLLVAVAKLAYGAYSGAIAVTADGFHSLLDASSNVVALVAAHLAARPPDRDHPYGHRKFEAFASLGIASLLVVACVRIGSSALQRLRSPEPPDITALGFVVIAATILVNLAVAAFERGQGKRLRSELLLADAAHTSSDVWTSVLVLVSFIAVMLGHAWADTAAALVIVAVILWAGVRVVSRAFRTLADAYRVPPEEVEAVALRVPGVLECHKVRSRGAAGDVHVDLHVLVDPEMPIAEAHRIGHEVEAAVRAAWDEITDVVVHVEPATASERQEDQSGERFSRRT